MIAEVRCSGCKRLLATELYGSVKIKCYKCKKINNIFTSENPTGNDPQSFILNNEKNTDRDTPIN